MQRQLSHLRLLVYLLNSSLLALASQNVTCYFPTGDPIAPESSPNDYYQACPTSFGGDEFRMCCKTDGGFNDVCETNGLCSRQHNPSLGEDQGLLRSTCTDPSWTSPSCLQLCTTGIDLLGDTANSSEEYVRPCADGSFCCEPPISYLNATLNATVETCCSQGKGMFILDDGKVSNVNPNATTSAANPTSTAKSTSSPTHTPTPPPKPSHTGAIVGGVVGGVLGLLVIAGAIWFFLRSRKRNVARREAEGMSAPAPEPTHRGEYSAVRMGEMEGAGLAHGNETVEKDGAEVLGMGKGGGGAVEMGGDQVGGGRRGPYEL